MVYTFIMSAQNDDVAFDHVTYEITMAENSTYKDGGQSNVELTTNVLGKKVILAAKNIGAETIEFVKYNVLYLNENGEVVGTDWGYIDNDDSKLMSGATEMREESCYDAFSDVKVVVHGRIDG